mgnify:CR=1 FL=1
MRLLGHSLGLLLAMVSSAGTAQTTGAINTDSTSDQAPAKQAPPQGSCMPIGITAAGDVVFPFECKEFLDKYKAEIDKSAALSGAPAPPTEAHAPEAAPAAATATSPSKDTPDRHGNATAAAKTAPAAPKGKTVAKQPERERKIADSDSGENRAAPLRHASASKRMVDKGTPVCMHFRSYDPESGTYRSYDGQIRSCPPE